VRSRTLPALAATLIALISAHAHADCTLLQPEKSFNLPGILNLPPDIDPAKAKQISGWYGLSNTDRPQFWCSSKSKISLRLNADSGTNETATNRDVIAADGQTYTPFDYTAGFPAVRTIVQYRYRLNDAPWSSWQPLNHRSANVPRFAPPTDSTNITVDARMALLAGPGTAAGHWTHSNPLTVSAQMDGMPAAVTSRFEAAPLDIAAASCSTSNVAVDMGGSTTLSKLTRIGSHTPLQPFTLAVSRCPAGFGHIQYQWDAATAKHDQAQGMAVLDNASSASGVGLQVADALGGPIKFGQRYTFSTQDPGNTGGYAIPLQAAYFRTGNVTPGSADTVVTFTLNYP
jgi:major type 1 subunit fimbrin (pilin)